ncbi:nucleolar protein dao-5-like [Teleopsis dalmanni]|uniref:nucleolar protein dao-5-like n=1 Tax=Teleopsis dalmanni TaxID=139649 RepID=UPI0018CF8592|nr:nucleolar protein dao-5-like [Teleopsis dalmanni]
MVIQQKPLDVTKPVTKDVFDDESSDDEFGLHKKKILELKPKPQDTKDDVLSKPLTEPKPTDKIDQKPSDVVIPKPLDVTKPVTKDVFDDESSDDEFGLHKEKIPEVKPKPQDTKDDVLSKPLTEPKPTDKIDQKPSAIVIPKPLDITKPVTKDVFDDESSDDEFGLHKETIPELKPKPQDTKDDVLSKPLTEPKPTDKIDHKPSDLVIPKPLDVPKPVTKDVFNDESSDDEFGLHKEKIPELKPKPQDTKDDVLPKPLTEPKPTDKIDQKLSAIVVPKPLDITKPVTKDILDDESSDDEFGLHKDKIPEMKPKPQDTKDDVLSKPLTEPKPTDKIDHKPSDVVIPKPLDITKPVTKNVFDDESSDDEFGLHKEKISERKPKPQDTKDDVLPKTLSEPKPTDKIDQKPSDVVIPKPLDVTKPVTKDVFDDEFSDDEFGLHKDKIPELKPKPQDTNNDVLSKPLTEPKPTDKIDHKPLTLLFPKPLEI